MGNLIETSDGMLYGTTRFGGVTNADYPSGMGTIFRFQKQNAHIETVLRFGGTNGAIPNAGFAKSPDGWLYGTTQFGGTNGNGTIFRVQGSSGQYEVLKHFTGTLDDALQPQGTLLRASDSAFYGVASGTDGIALVFKIDAQNFKIVARLLDDYGDGWGPYAVGSSGGLIESQSGVLYGTTALGYLPFPDGSGITYDSAHGAIFSLTKEGLNVQVNSFPFDLSGSAMSTPTGRLLLAKDGYIYGTEQWGENDNSGSVFRLSIESAPLNPTVIALFGFPLLASGPQAGIIEDAEGLFYGTTSRSIGFRVGSDFTAVGSVFSFDATNGIINPLKVFHSVDGAAPIGEVVFASDGGLYGTTSGGGEKSCGTIFGIFAKPQSLIEGIMPNQDTIQIRARGTDSTTFILQVSDSVATGVWHDIATNSPTTSSSLAFSIPTNSATQFFRVASQTK